MGVVDNHADIMAAGMTFVACTIPICDLYLCPIYHGESAPIENLPIVSSVIAIDTEHKILFEFGRSLDFTGSMDIT
jgi:hypothetical protein